MGNGEALLQARHDTGTQCFQQQPLIPHSSFPIPHSPFLIPHSSFQIPHSPLPIPVISLLSVPFFAIFTLRRNGDDRSRCFVAGDRDPSGGLPRRCCLFCRMDKTAQALSDAGNHAAERSRPVTRLGYAGRGRGMGKFVKGDVVIIPHSPLPIPHSPSPVPHSPLLIPYSPSPILHCSLLFALCSLLFPHSPFPIPHSSFLHPCAPVPILDNGVAV